ncbi:MAG TPA: hypothetical protein VK359_06705 [Rubrobacteraceae bacterium]|nr:hypothetical protein [Rubrobacteraceae bacterium]
MGVMLIAIGLAHVALGIGLIVTFSFSLAAVLIAIGILLVHFKSSLDWLGKPGSSWQRLSPLASAVIVTLLGAGGAIKGLMTYMG